MASDAVGRIKHPEYDIPKTTQVDKMKTSTKVIIGLSVIIVLVGATWSGLYLSSNEQKAYDFFAKTLPQFMTSSVSIGDGIVLKVWHIAVLGGSVITISCLTGGITFKVMVEWITHGGNQKAVLEKENTKVDNLKPTQTLQEAIEEIGEKIKKLRNECQIIFGTLEEKKVFLKKKLNEEQRQAVDEEKRLLEADLLQKQQELRALEREIDSLIYMLGSQVTYNQATDMLTAVVNQMVDEFHQLYDKALTQSDVCRAGLSEPLPAVDQGGDEKKDEEEDKELISPADQNLQRLKRDIDNYVQIYDRLMQLEIQIKEHETNTQASKNRRDVQQLIPAMQFQGEYQLKVSIA